MNIHEFAAYYQHREQFVVRLLSLGATEGQLKELHELMQMLQEWSERTPYTVHYLDSVALILHEAIVKRDQDIANKNWELYTYKDSPALSKNTRKKK